MNDYCVRCKVAVSDYDGELGEILEQVKIQSNSYWNHHNPEAMKDTPGADQPKKLEKHLANESSKKSR